MSSPLSIPFPVIRTPSNQAVDAYINGLEPSISDMVRSVRRVAQEACPMLEEALKWGMPTLSHHGIVAQIAGFKKHARLAFWKGALLESTWLEVTGEAQVMGHIRMEKPEDIPPEEVLVDLFVRAVDLNVRGIKPSAPRVRKRAPLEPPDWFLAALQAAPPARAIFEAMPPSHQREYVEWLVDAKRDETRLRRLEQAVEWISEGKHRNWKHM